MGEGHALKVRVLPGRLISPLSPVSSWREGLIFISPSVPGSALLEVSGRYILTWWVYPCMVKTVIFM